MTDTLNLNIRGLTADRLRTIYYVAQTQSATKAGEKLFLCQSAVTKQIQQIEDELGFMLFYRRERKFYLTSMGQKIYELAQRTLHDIDGTLKSLKEQYEGDMAGTLKILTFPSFASVMAPRYLKGFREKYPNIRMTISASFDCFPVSDSDISIRGFFTNQPDLEQLELYKEQYGLYASREYLEKYGEPKTLAELDRHKLLAIDEGLKNTYPDINWILRVGVMSGNCHREAEMYFASNDSLANGVVNGLGIGGLAVHHVKALENKNLVRLLPEYETASQPVCFIFNKHVSPRSKYLALYDFMMEKIRESSK